MIEMLKQLFGRGPKIDSASLIANGAVVIDVRTRQEFAGGHVKGSINIPLDVLTSRLKEIPRNKPVITCCASGMRSASAQSILLNKGYTEVYNGGSWRNL